MSRARVAVLKVASGQLSVAELPLLSTGSLAAIFTAFSLVYRRGGLDALEPRSRRPRTNPAADL